MMLKLVRFIFLVGLLIGVSILRLEATHLRAGDITVKRTGDCGSYKYTITLHIYTRWVGPVKFSMGGAGSVNFGDGSKIFHPQEVDNPPIIAYTKDGNVGEVTYPIDHVFPGPGTYIISYYEPNRNDKIDNINDSVETPFYVQTQIVIDPFLGCDNTPELLVPPIDHGCTGVKWSHNAGAYDPDGDSLSYELYVPKQGAVYDAGGNYVSGIDVNGYAAPNSQRFYDAAGVPYSKANENGDGPPIFNIDPITGTVTWDAPGKAGEFNIAFIIREWRKIYDVSGVAHWISLGYVERDMQIIIEDCHNERPQLQTPADLCVVAGTKVTQLITSTDADGGPKGGARGLGDSVKIEAFSQVFTINPSPATYKPGPVWQYISSATATAHIEFDWQTNCAHVKEQPYNIVFKATDNGAPPLATFKTWNIRVVAPPPVWVAATLNPGQRSAQLTWQTYTCSANASIMQVWRRVDSSPFVPPPCVTGIPDSLGYSLIATLPVTATGYTDKGLAVGAKYCYRLVAAFPLPDGGESIVSSEICIPPIIASGPVITNVTVDITDEQAGQVTVRWRPPFEASATQFPPPYSYEVYRADGFSGKANLVKTFAGRRPDTVWVDTGLNTTLNIYNYRIKCYDNSGNPVDTSAVASTVRLDLKSSLKEIQLAWNASVPWANNSFSYPWHRIYRSTNSNSKQISDMVLIDSINVNQHQYVYLDSGQYNGQPLEKTQNYCYAVMTRGSYGNPKIKAPLINFSEITCAVPNDTTPPCQPVISVTGVDCSSFTNCPTIGTSGSVSYSNTIKWKKPPASCKQTIRGYNVYAASSVGQDFTKIASLVTDTFYVHLNLPSFAQCYKISAVDRAGNESDLSDQYCFDNCPYYELPNVFTPNGDGCNDKFSAFSIRSYGDDGYPCGTGSIKQDSVHFVSLKSRCARFVTGVNFIVYNRWGREVYNYKSGGENTIYIDWNGKDNEGRDLDAGTYYYTAIVGYDVVDPKKRNHTTKGWVQIFR